MSKRQAVAALLRQYQLGDSRHEIVIKPDAIDLLAARITALFEEADSGHHVMTPPSADSGIKSG
jgi:hypothetical protein